MLKTICLQGSQFVNIILDAPGSVEIERRCHFGDNEILKYAMYIIILYITSLASYTSSYFGYKLAV